MKKKITLLTSLLLLVIISGCGTTISDNPKMKPEYSKNFSDTFVSMSEAVAKIDVLLYKAELNDQTPINSSDSLQQYLDEYQNSNDTNQNEIVDMIRTVYRDYLAYGMDKQFLEVQKEGKETGQNNLTDSDIQQATDEENKRLPGEQKQIKQDVDKLTKYFN